MGAPAIDILGCFCVFLTVTAFPASGIARWIIPRRSSRGVRSLAWSVGWLVASAVVAAVAAVAALRVMPRASVDDVLRLEAARITSPTAAELVSLSRASVPPPCDEVIITNWSGHAGGSSGETGSTGLRRCGLGRFEVDSSGHHSYGHYSGV
ncbi:MAG: hypothetical protein Q8S73_21535 [Deltaproteobacteria bacterium]|nr:hypothetical protein [Deltaproteobacteria bacterium]